MHNRKHTTTPPRTLVKSGISLLLAISMTTMSFPLTSVAAFAQDQTEREAPVATTEASSNTADNATPEEPAAGDQAAPAEGTAEEKADQASDNEGATFRSAPDTESDETETDAADPAALTEIWVSSEGNDDNDGSSADQAFATMKKALEVQAANPSVAVINLQGTFGSWDAVTIPSGVTLKVAADTTITGAASKNGITLASGAKLTAGEHTLTMSGFATALVVKAGAEVNDGHYALDGNTVGFNLQGSFKGTGRDQLVVTAVNTQVSPFTGVDVWLENCTVTVQAKNEGGEQYGAINLKNASLTTRGVWYYVDPSNGKGGIHMDHSDFYVYKATGSSAYKQSIAILGDSYLRNGSTLTGDGARITLSAKLTVDDSKVVVKNSTRGGLNINYKPATAIFTNSTLETSNMRFVPSYGTGYTDGPAYMEFRGNSVVNTDAKDKDADNGGAQRSNGSTYVVTGGSYLVKYDPTYNHDVTTPTNGTENGDEWLSYFTLADTSVMSLSPINKNGDAYTYPVANASADGKKHVFTPAATVTVKLNNGNATFADGTTADKSFSTIRGYKLPDVEGNDAAASLGTPADSKGVTFLGWFYKDASGVEHEFDYANTVFSTDTEVYAKWDAKTVVYHNGAGASFIQSIESDQDSATVLSFEDVAKANKDFNIPGKQFSKWTAAPDGSGDAVTAGSTLAFENGVTQLDLYAQYNADTYRVAFSANGGTFGASSVFKTNPDIFTIEQDPVRGGEVAVVKAGATYNQKLSELLGNFARGKITPKTAAATKTGFVLNSDEYWSASPALGGSGLRFDDYKLFGLLTMSGENPAFTADTTYYLTWKNDDKVKSFDNEGTMLADLWGSSELGQDNSTTLLRQGAADGKTFSLTGAVDVASIKQQMSDIESQFSGVDPADITLTGTTSLFKAVLTLPEGVNAPSKLDKSQVQATGLGDLFEVKGTEVRGKKVTVTFGLKKAYTSYEELKAAVLGTGTSDAASTIADAITLTVPGFSLDKSKVSNGQELTVTGTVDGSFNSVASAGEKTLRFNLTWKGTQVPAGKDVRAKDDTSIQQTILVKKAYETDIPADMLVYVQPDGATAEQQKQAGTDTTHGAPAGVYAGSTVNLTGTVDAKTVKQQMEAIEGEFGNPTDFSSIALTKLSSPFTATFTVPEGLTLPEDLSPETVIPAGFADTFAVTKIESTPDGRSVSVTFALKGGIENYQQLKTAVDALDDTMKLTVPGIKVNDDVLDGTELPIKGTVTGSFDAVATSANGTEKDFSFTWTGTQIPDGKDSKAADDKVIQLTLATPAPQDADLPADMLSGADTEHKAAHAAFAGSTIPLTGAVRIDGVKKQMEAIEDQFGNPDGTKIATDIKGFGFTATMTLPEGMELPEDLSKDMVVFEQGEGVETFEVTDVKAEGQKVTVKFGLKDASKLDTYAKLKEAVGKAGVEKGTWLKLTVPGVTIADTVAEGAKLTAVGTVSGYFKAVATSEKGTTKAFSFRWNGTQWEDGKDATTPADDERITFTVQVPSAPQQSDLPADILSGNDTEHTSIYQVYPGRTLDLTGAVRIDGVKKQMEAIEDQFGNPDGTKIATDIKGFGFTATMTLPEGMELPEDLSKDMVVFEQGEGVETFEVTDVKAEGQKVTVKFGLKDASKLDTYAKLKEAVGKAGVEKGTWLKLTVPGVTIADSVKPGEKLVVRGTVTGLFKAIATSASGTTQPFSFTWNGVQWPDGKDVDAGSDEAIRFTAMIPTAMQLGLDADMLIGNDTTHDATPEVTAGSTVDLTGLVKIDGVKQQMEAIEAQFRNPDGTAIKTDIRDFGFTATMTLPEGMSFPEDLDKSKVRADGFEDTFEVTGVEVDGRKVTVTFGLKDASKLDTYAKLKEAVGKAGVENGTALTLTVPGVKIASDLEAGKVLTTTGTVTGEFGAVATSASGKRELFLFTWTGTQLKGGEDKIDADGIKLSVKVTAAPVETGTVIIKYVDENGKEIAKSVELSGKVGDAYTAEQLTIDGYTYVRLADDSAPLAGTFAKDPQTVTLVYKKNEPGKPGKSNTNKQGKGKKNGKTLPQTGDVTALVAIPTAATGLAALAVALRRRRKSGDAE